MPVLINMKSLNLVSLPFFFSKAKIELKSSCFTLSCVSITVYESWRIKRGRNAIDFECLCSSLDWKNASFVFGVQHISVSTIKQDPSLRDSTLVPSLDVHERVYLWERRENTVVTRMTPKDMCDFPGWYLKAERLDVLYGCDSHWLCRDLISHMNVSLCCACVHILCS